MIKYYWLFRYAFALEPFTVFGCWVEYMIRVDETVAQKYKEGGMVALIEDYSRSKLLHGWMHPLVAKTYIAIALNLKAALIPVENKARDLHYRARKAIASFGGVK